MIKVSGIISLLLLITDCGNRPIHVKEFGKSSLTSVELNIEDENQLKLFCFMTYHCPISMAQVSKLNSLIDQYGKAMEFYIVIPELNFSLNADFLGSQLIQAPARILIDDQLALTGKLEATVTPQYILVQNSRVIYTGKLDNANSLINIPSFDKEYVNYVSQAILAIQSGSRPSVAWTDPVGCRIE